MFYGRCFGCKKNFRPYDEQPQPKLVTCCPHCKSTAITFIDDPVKPSSEEQISQVHKRFAKLLEKHTTQRLRIWGIRWHKHDLSETLLSGGKGKEEDNG